MSRISIPKIIAAGALLYWALVAQAAVAASATSDALIVLQSDGKSFTVQHTIASEGPLIALEIPANAQSRQLSFLGPNKDLHQENQSERGNTVQLWDGVALVRYQHRYEDEITQTSPNTYRLSLPSLPQNFAVENGDITRSSYTWVFPENIELISYSAVSEDMGRWQLNETELGYEQTERFAVTLTIEYKVMLESHASVLTKSADANETLCFPTPDNPDLCAEDSDTDSVPDYRDVCWKPQTPEFGLNPSKEDDQNLAGLTVNASFDSQALKTESSENKPSNAQWAYLLGCEQTEHIILSDVQFPSGYSYLDVSSRDALNRLAQAMQINGSAIEIGAHTDNAGNADTNLALAQKRANTVRYYLLLRGVKPNQIRATGYGEEFPIFDNTTPEGRRGNRRIEITELQ